MNYYFLHLLPNQWKLRLLIFLCNKKCYKEHIFIHVYWNFFKNYPQEIELLSRRICIFNFTGCCQISHQSDCANLNSLYCTLATEFLFPCIMVLCVHAKLLQSTSQLCLTLCDPVDYSSSGSSVHEILQARILEWVAMPFPRGSSRPRDRTHASYLSCIGRQVLYPQRHVGSPNNGIMRLQISPI